MTNIMTTHNDQSQKISTNIPFLFVKIIILFFYVYEFNLSTFGLPTFVTSRRISSLLLVVLALSKMLVTNSTFKIKNKSFGSRFIYRIFLINLGLLVYVNILAFVGLSGNGETIDNYIIETILFCLIPLLTITSIFKDLDEFMFAVLIVTIIQAFIVLFCELNVSFCTFIDTNFSTDFEYVKIHRGYYGGGLACITAPGLFRFAIGFVSCIYFYQKRAKLKYVFIYLFFSFIGSWIARTGLIISAIGFIFILFSSKKNRRISMLLKTILLFLIVVVAFYVLYNLNFQFKSFIDSSFFRMFALFQNGIKEEFLNGYWGNASGNIFPSINEYTFWGTGLISGKTLMGDEAYVDGGYIKLFFAFGLPFCLGLYVFIFGNIFSLIRKNKNIVIKFTILFALIVLIIGEFKEFILYTQLWMFFICAIILLGEKESNINEI